MDIRTMLQVPVFDAGEIASKRLQRFFSIREHDVK